MAQNSQKWQLKAFSDTQHALQVFLYMVRKALKVGKVLYMIHRKCYELKVLDEKLPQSSDCTSADRMHGSFLFDIMPTMNMQISSILHVFKLFQKCTKLRTKRNIGTKTAVHA